ncbi:MAG: isoprenylcysteine carboxylmethyltransferase family protein [Actinomycetota bacterium]
MDLDLRQLAVLILFSLTLLLRIVAHRQAGGVTRDQSDGIELEGGTAVAVLMRLLFLVGGLGGIITWMIAPDLLPGSVELPAVVHWIGIGLAEAGLVLLMAVHVALGVHFSGTLHLRGDHRLVRTGPYARIRHPMYTSFLLLFGGLSVLIANVPIAVILLGSQVWVIGWRLPKEEAQLAARFGGEWHHYRSDTARLVPRFGVVRRAAS